MRQIIRRTDHQQIDAQLSRLCFAIANDSQEEEAFEGFSAEVFRFDPHGAKALIFRNDWGREMTPVWREAAGTHIAVTSGRACKGFAPWIFVREASGKWYFAGLETFGNWRLELTADGVAVFSYDSRMLSGVLRPEEEISVGGAITAYSEDFHSLCADVCRHLRNTLPPTRLDPALVSWNHWWRYEDAEVTEEIVLENARLAKEMGIGLIVLDAGWFGAPQKETDWTKLRGDWDCVNTQRFPHGLAWLAGQIHDMGMKFGLWLESEGMGERSELRSRYPQWEATRSEGLPQPYLCLGADGAADWLYDQIARLVELTQADYLKLDFNVDPGFGCDRSDHGHHGGMGLFMHMKNYTALLDKLRKRYAHLMIENCSSGGMRLDLTMLAHTDVSFLSDPDESEHSLQVFLWQCFLPPERLLHWAWSQTRTYADGSYVFPPLDHARLADHTDAAMLHPFGFSRDLTEMTTEQRAEIAKKIAFFQMEIAPMLRDGVIRLETLPPLRQNRVDDGREFSQISFAANACSCIMKNKNSAMRLTYCREGAKIHFINQEESLT